MDDIINRPEEQQETPAPPKRRGCLRRLLLGLLLVLGVCACVFFWFAHNTRSKPPYSTALELIQNDPKLIEHLGEPIRNVRWLPSGNFPSQFQIQVKGPKGMADVSVTAGKFEGQWEVTALNARVYDPDNPHDSATTFPLDIGTSAGDAPAFKPGGSTTEGESKIDIGLEPPAGIDIELPDGPPGVEIELPGSGPLGVEIELPDSGPPGVEIKLSPDQPAPES